MAKTERAPWYARAGNVMTTTLLRAGVKLNGFKKYPMYLMTVRGRKSGQPRTISIAIMEREGKRYLGAPYGEVNWVRNLRAAKEAVLTRGRRSETVRAIELPRGEAAVVLKAEVEGGNPFSSYFGVTKESSPEEYERAVASHPIFLMEAK
jgi:deazaflavin-dependent oxidoreductase (nitroreductase family)